MTLHDALRYDVWLTKAALAEKCGTTPRDIEAAVELARKNAELPIMSGPDGYRFARTADEYADNIEARRRRALNQLVTVRGERRYLRRWRAVLAEQRTLWPAA